MNYITRNRSRSMTLSFARWACVSHPLAQPIPEPRQVTDAYITVAPVRHLDLLFMVDNSPSMKPKQDKMKAQFPKLIDALRDPDDQTLADLRIAIVGCAPGAGKSTRCSATGGYGDNGQFQMRG